MRGDGGCRVGEVRASTTSPMPDHKGFKLQQLVNFQKFSTVRVNKGVQGNNSILSGCSLLLTKFFFILIDDQAQY